MPAQPSRLRYDVVIAGARCAGASTAMLLARRGLRVLVVDPSRRGSDTLSTHALMRGAVQQLHRWGLLDAIRASGTPAIRHTTFHYGEETVTIPVKARDGTDALYAPRRTVLDAVLVDAAVAAGAEVVHGQSVIGLVRNGEGRVCGARIAGADQRVTSVKADLVIGADGVRSRVARLLSLSLERTSAHATSSVYGHFKGVGLGGYHWYYNRGASVGSIPTNAGASCIFVSVPPKRFQADRADGVAGLFRRVLGEVSGDLLDRLGDQVEHTALRAFAGTHGFLRRAAGPGWALAGDAGYFRDPLTAHGITDALREAEYLSRAVLEGSDAALHGYSAARDQRVAELFNITDRIASFAWDLEEVKVEHLNLSRAMNALAQATDGRALSSGVATAVQVVRGRSRHRPHASR